MLSHRVLILASATALFGTVLLQGGVAEALPECVDTIGVSSHTDIDGGVGQLREALSEVCDGGSVLIEPGTIVLERGRFTIEESRTVTIIGLGNGDEPEVAIDANGTDRIFTVNAHAALTLDSVRLTGGNVVGHGGAVEALDARLVVIDST
ncbi:MAG: hypothetical protein OEO77_14415, partial [Acidimicrobiia bacterium]|nr:hypothetical protein [Acidimicrobiia bacterium]